MAIRKHCSADARPVPSLPRAGGLPVVAGRALPALPVRSALAAASCLLLAVVILAGCSLLVDPAEPPFGDRIVATRSVESVLGDFNRHDLRMSVLDNGSRQYLLVHGAGPDGRRHTVVFADNLSRRLSRPDLWDVEIAFVHVNGDFVIGDAQFAGRDFSPVADPIEFGDDPEPPPHPRTGIARPGDLLFVAVGGDDRSELILGPAYSEDWTAMASPNPNDPPSVPIYPDPGSDPDDPGALGGFGLRAAHHDLGRGRSGLVFWNEELHRTIVIEISPELAGELIDDPPDFVTDSAPTLVLSARDYHEVIYTRSGIVVIDQDHTLYDLSSGNRKAEYSRDWGGDFIYAYSPDGRWLYALDLQRYRLYKARTWW